MQLVVEGGLLWIEAEIDREGLPLRGDALICVLEGNCWLKGAILNPGSEVIYRVSDFRLIESVYPVSAVQHLLQPRARAEGSSGVRPSVDGPSVDGPSVDEHAIESARGECPRSGGWLGDVVPRDKSRDKCTLRLRYLSLPRMLDSAHVCAFVYPWSWARSVANIEARAAGIEDRSSLPRVLVMGAAGSGKSTYSVVLLNSLIRSHGSCALVDVDLGQPLVGVPGLVTLSLFESPFLLDEGSGLASWSRVVAKVSPSGVEADYVEAISELQRLYARYSSVMNKLLPLVINTCGWVVDMGAQLIDLIAWVFQVTDCVHLSDTQVALALPSRHEANLSQQDPNLMDSSGVDSSCVDSSNTATTMANTTITTSPSTAANAANSNSDCKLESTEDNKYPVTNYHHALSAQSQNQNLNHNEDENEFQSESESQNRNRNQNTNTNTNTKPIPNHGESHGRGEEDGSGDVDQGVEDGYHVSDGVPMACVKRGLDHSLAPLAEKCSPLPLIAHPVGLPYLPAASPSSAGRKAPGATTLRYHAVVGKNDKTLFSTTDALPAKRAGWQQATREPATQQELIYFLTRREARHLRLVRALIPQGSAEWMFHTACDCVGAKCEATGPQGWNDCKRYRGSKAARALAPGFEKNFILNALAVSTDTGALNIPRTVFTGLKRVDVPRGQFVYLSVKGWYVGIGLVLDHDAIKDVVKIYTARTLDYNRDQNYRLTPYPEMNNADAIKAIHFYGHYRTIKTSLPSPVS